MKTEQSPLTWPVLGKWAFGALISAVVSFASYVTFMVNQQTNIYRVENDRRVEAVEDYGKATRDTQMTVLNRLSGIDVQLSNVMRVLESNSEKIDRVIENTAWGKS